MLAVLNAVPAAHTAITLPLVLTVALATVALVGVAVYVRRARRNGRLTGVTATASGVSAAGILASALLVSVALGSAGAASASTPTQHSDTPSVQAPVSDDLSGYQLTTE
ncbi:hypothetical protein [Glaciihabitans sp. UYNi722]|uniref:hypothetical protein n=1 Tax=Glaciihabitans sp. UYNi722 TaxID=3156344 RepID=UPI00339703B2